MLPYCPHCEPTCMGGPSWSPGSSAQVRHTCPFRAHVNKATTLHALESHRQPQQFQFHWLFNPAPSIIYSSLAIHQIFILPMNFPAWTCHYEGRGEGWGVTTPGNAALLKNGVLPLSFCWLHCSLSSPAFLLPAPISQPVLSFYGRCQELWIQKSCRACGSFCRSFEHLDSLLLILPAG